MVTDVANCVGKRERVREVPTELPQVVGRWRSRRFGCRKMKV